MASKALPPLRSTSTPIREASTRALTTMALSETTPLGLSSSKGFCRQLTVASNAKRTMESKPGKRKLLICILLMKLFEILSGKGT